MSKCDVNLVHTSTPILKSTKGKLILKEIFLSNLPKDVTAISKEDSNSIRDESDDKIKSPVVIYRDVKKFLELKREEEEVSVVCCTPPRSITPSTKRLLYEYYLRSVKKLKIESRKGIRL